MMKRRISIFVLLFAVLLVSCAKFDITYDELSGMCAAGNENYSASVRVNITFGEEDTTLMFAHGDYTADGTDMHAEFSQTVLGIPSAVVVGYDGETLKTVSKTTIDGETTETESEEIIEKSELFSRLIYTRPFVPESESVKSIEKIQTANGTGYKAVFENATDVLFPLLGDSIYELAKIKVPQTELTEIENAEAIYVSDGEKVKSFTLMFDLIIVETPPYVPGQNTADIEDYTLRLKVSFYATYE